MVRIIPSRLKPHLSSSTTNSSSANSRSNSPLRSAPSQSDMLSASEAKEAGLVLKVVVIRVSDDEAPGRRRIGRLDLLTIAAIPRLEILPPRIAAEHQTP